MVDVGQEVEFRMKGRVTLTAGGFLQVENGQKTVMVNEASIMPPRPANWPPQKHTDPFTYDVWIDEKNACWYYKEVETMPGKKSWKMTTESPTGIVAWSTRWFLAKHPKARLYSRGGKRVR